MTTPGRDDDDKREKDERLGKHAVCRRYGERVKETTALSLHGFIRYYLFNYLTKNSAVIYKID